jgi:lysophospholipase L1-like esterase
MRNTFISIALFLGSVTGFLLLGEGAIRVYAALSFPRLTQPDAALGWKQTPNARKRFTNELGETAEVRYNEHGHRGPSYPLAREQGKPRILVLGDSFTGGTQVGDDELFTALLERFNPGWQVLNAGVAGYGTLQQLLYLQTSGLKHQPDLVLLMAFENDLTDNCSPAYPGIGPRPYARLSKESIEVLHDPEGLEFRKYALPVPFLTALNQHSHLFYFLNTYIYQPLRAQEMRARHAADWARAEQCGTVEVMSRLLDRMVRITADHDTRLAVVIIPTREEARQGKATVLDPVARYCAQHGIPHLSLLEAMHRHKEAALAYFPKDIHWTRQGHQVAAQAISVFLRELATTATQPRRP